MVTARASAPAGGAIPFFTIERPELTDELADGDARLRKMMHAGRRSFVAGKTIVSGDRDQPHAYLLRSGWCARVRHMRDGRSQIAAVLLPGDLFCTASIFAIRQTDDIVALDAVVADCIDQDQLMEAVRASWPVAARCFYQLIEDNRRVHNWLVAIGNGSAEERLALLLVELRARLVLAGELASDANRFALPMTQGQIGDALGLTAVHINRTLRRLREQNIAAIGRGEARIEDLGRLHRLARPLLDIYERDRSEYGAASASPFLAFMGR